MINTIMLSTFSEISFILRVFKLYLESYCEEKKSLKTDQSPNYKVLFGKIIFLETQAVDVCLHSFLGNSISGIVLDVLLVPEIEPKLSLSLVECLTAPQISDQNRFILCPCGFCGWFVVLKTVSKK